MKALLITFLCCIAILSGCTKHEDAVAIDENTFVYGSKVYRIIDNEVMQISDLSSETMRKFDANKVQTRDFGNASLEHIKAGASSIVSGSYRNNKMYYKITVTGLNDLKEKFQSGMFYIKFYDSLGYTIHEIPVETDRLIGEIGSDNHTIEMFSYHGTSEILFHTFERIKSYSVASNVKKEFSYKDMFATPSDSMMRPAPAPARF